MPFSPAPDQRPDGFASHTDPTRAATPDPVSAAPVSGPSVVMRVHPDKVVALMNDLQAVRDRVRDFLRREAVNLAVPPMAGDPVSKRASEAFTKNAESAVRVAYQFVDELDKQIASLKKAADRYNLVEEANTATFDKRS